MSLSTITSVNGNLTQSNPTTTTTGASATQQQQLPMNDEVRAQIVISTPSNMKACGERLRRGDLVAFPTETVYGLGCNALDETAISKVFQAKERPFTDPVIAHVLTAEDAFQLWSATAKNATGDSSTSVLSNMEGRLLSSICRRFWPGPLTLVAKANHHVPKTLMAGTEYVACRSPSGLLARALLMEAGIPLGAPSANKFGHVSPTTAQHVYDDLLYEDVWILQQDDQGKNNSYGNSNNLQGSSTPVIDDVTCKVGVESTVAKLEMVGETKAVLTVLRQGAVSAHDLEECLSDVVRKKEGGATWHDGVKNSPWTVEVRLQLKRATKDHVPNVAPGQTIRHYSPRIPSYMVSETCIQRSCQSSSSGAENDHHVDVDVLKDAVVVDYGKRLLPWRDRALDYRDLSTTGNSIEAAQAVFDTLRWAEQVPEAKVILFPVVFDIYDDGDDEKKKKNTMIESDALMLAVQDRLTRAASGVVIDCFDDIPKA